MCSYFLVSLACLQFGDVLAQPKALDIRAQSIFIPSCGPSCYISGQIYAQREQWMGSLNRQSSPIYGNLTHAFEEAIEKVIQHSSLSKSLLHLEVASMEAKPDHLVRLRTQFYMNRMEEPIHKKEIELVIKTAIEDMPVLDFHFLSQNLSFSLINPNNISEVFSPAFLKTVKAKRWALNFGPFYYALKVFGITVVIMIFIGIGAFCQSLKTSKEAKIRQAREEVAKLFQFIAQAQVLEEAQLKGDRLALSLPLLKEEVTQRRFTLQCAAQLAQRNYTHFRNGVDNKAFSTDPTAKDEPKAQAIIEMKDMTKSVRTDQAKQVEDRTGMIDTWVSQTVKSTTGHEIDAHYEETSFIEGDVQGTSTKVKGIKASKKKVNAMQTVAMVH